MYQMSDDFGDAQLFTADMRTHLCRFASHICLAGLRKARDCLVALDSDAHHASSSLRSATVTQGKRRLRQWPAQNVKGIVDSRKRSESQSRPSHSHFMFTCQPIPFRCFGVSTNTVLLSRFPSWHIPRHESLETDLKLA